MNIQTSKILTDFFGVSKQLRGALGPSLHRDGSCRPGITRPDSTCIRLSPSVPRAVKYHQSPEQYPNDRAPGCHTQLSPVINDRQSPGYPSRAAGSSPCRLNQWQHRIDRAHLLLHVACSHIAAESEQTDKVVKLITHMMHLPSLSPTSTVNSVKDRARDHGGEHSTCKRSLLF